MHLTSSEISETLKKAESKQLLEIIRQAELYLECQLTAALAADQRAAVFASILAGTLAVLMGGGVSLVIAGDKFLLVTIPFVPLVGTFIVALWNAIYACRPTSFEYSGNTPSNWLADIKSKKTLNDSMAEQAQHYAKMIDENDRVLRENNQHIQTAIDWALTGVFAGVISALPIVLWILA